MHFAKFLLALGATAHNLGLPFAAAKQTDAQSVLRDGILPAFFDAISARERVSSMGGGADVSNINLVDILPNVISASAAPTQPEFVQIDLNITKDVPINLVLKTIHLKLEFKKATLFADHADVDVHVSGIGRLDEPYNLRINFKNTWTLAHSWDIDIGIAGAHVHLETRVDASSCKLLYRFHTTGSGLAGHLDESSSVYSFEHELLSGMFKGLSLC